MSLQATGGTLIDHQHTTLRLLGNLNATGNGTGTLIVQGGASITNDLWVNNNLLVPLGSIQAKSVQITQGAHEGYVLTSDISGIAHWDLCADYRIIDCGPSKMYTMKSVGIGTSVINTRLAVDGDIGYNGNLVINSNTNTSILFDNFLNFGSNILISNSGQIGIGTSNLFSDKLVVNGDIRLDGVFRYNSFDLTLPDNTDTLAGITATQTMFNKTLVEPSVTGNANFQDSGRIIQLQDPINSQDATTKNYVDNLVNGLDWQESVIAIVPGISSIQDPTTGDRYLMGNTGVESEFGGIVSFNGITWTEDTINTNDIVYSIAQGITLIFDGIEWKDIVFETLIQEIGLVSPDDRLVPDRFIVGTSPVNDFSTFSTNSIAILVSGIWSNSLPHPGDSTIVYYQDNEHIVFTGTNWTVITELSVIGITSILPEIPEIDTNYLQTDGSIVAFDGVTTSIIPEPDYTLVNDSILLIPGSSYTFVGVSFPDIIDFTNDSVPPPGNYIIDNPGTGDFIGDEGLLFISDGITGTFITPNNYDIATIGSSGIYYYSDTWNPVSGITSAIINDIPDTHLGDSYITGSSIATFTGITWSFEPLVESNFFDSQVFIGTTFIPLNELQPVYAIVDESDTELHPGDRYIVSGISATGDFESLENQIVKWNGNFWIPSDPHPGIIYPVKFPNYTEYTFSQDNFTEANILDPVLDSGLLVFPREPIIGDRYIDDISKNIVEYSTHFDWTIINPKNGEALLVKQQERQYVFNGTDWVVFGTWISHGSLNNLESDDHPQYLLLKGRTGGQEIIGGKGDSDSLVLYGNSLGSGNVYINDNKGNVGIGTTDVRAKLHVFDNEFISEVRLDDWSIIRTENMLEISKDDVNKLNILHGTTGNITMSDFIIINPVESSLSIIGINSKVVLSNDLLDILAQDSKLLLVSGIVTIASESERVGINNENPDSDLVIGSNLGSHYGLSIGNDSPGIYIGSSSDNKMSIEYHPEIESGIVNVNKLLLNAQVGISISPRESLDTIGNIRLSGVLIDNSGTEFELPNNDISDVLLSRNSIDVVTRKVLDSSSVYFGTTSNLILNLLGASGSSLTLLTNQNNNRLLSFPELPFQYSDYLVSRDSIDTLNNKTFHTETSLFRGDSYSTLDFVLQGSSGTNLTLISNQTIDTFLNFPIPGITSDYIVSRNSTDTLNNKTLDNPFVINGMNITSGDLSVSGNLFLSGSIFIQGTHTIIDNTVVQVSDSLIHLADGNPADTLDIGFFATFMDSGITKYTGLFRDSSDSERHYTFFDNLEIEPTSNVSNSFERASIAVDSIDLNRITSRYDNISIFDGKFILGSTGEVCIGTTVGLHGSHSGLSINKKSYFDDTVNINTDLLINTSTILGIGTISSDGITLVITGSGTKFTSTVKIGDRIENCFVIGVSSDTELIIDSIIAPISNSIFEIQQAPLIINDSLIISDQCHLGIGILNPSSPLTIGNSTSTWAINTETYSSGETRASIFMASDSGHGMSINTHTNNTTDYALYIFNDDNDLLRVQNNGSIGMGTDTPLEYLHCTGNAQINTIKLGNWIGVSSDMAIGHSDLKTDSSAYAIRQLHTGETRVNGLARVDHCVSDSSKITILSSGNVGIGIESPGYTLQVAGNTRIQSDLIVDGNLIVSGVSVSLEASSISVEDPFIKLASGNPSDTSDIGFFGEYTSGGTIRNAGFYRDSSDSIFKIFDNVQGNLGSTSTLLGLTGYRSASLQTNNLIIQGSVSIDNGLSQTPLIVSTNRTLDNTFGIILVDASVSNIVLTLPINALSGTMYTIIRRDSSGNIVTIQAPGSDLIDYEYSNYQLYNKYEIIKLLFLGADMDTPSISVWSTI